MIGLPSQSRRDYFVFNQKLEEWFDVGFRVRVRVRSNIIFEQAFSTCSANCFCTFWYVLEDEVLAYFGESFVSSCRGFGTSKVFLRIASLN